MPPPGGSQNTTGLSVFINCAGVVTIFRTGPPAAAPRTNTDGIESIPVRTICEGFVASTQHRIDTGSENIDMQGPGTTEHKAGDRGAAKNMVRNRFTR